MNRSVSDAQHNPALGPLTSGSVSAEEMKNYEPEFNLVFSRSDVCNIAVTGSPASNNSAVVKSWKETHSPKRWMNVSLPRFNQETSQVSNSAGEDALINQIVCQMSLAKSPKTRFRSIMKRNYALDAVVALVAAAFVALTIFLVWIAGLLPSSRPAPALCVLAFVGWLGCIAFGVFQLARTNAIGRLLERFKLRNADIELASGKDDSRLERYMGDLVYLLNTNDYDNIVFEGLDTYRSLPLFERLHALNLLANSQRPENREPLRFFYVVGDGLFDNPHDRAKFFDYIIPVIPYIDPSNSLMLFKNGLTEVGISVDDDFLYRLSRYVDDPSILRDIVNESRHYKVGLLDDESASEEDVRQLIALLTYKALFPRDFEMLQAGQGYVNALLKSRPAIIKEMQSRDSENTECTRKSLAELLEDMNNPDLVFENPPYAQGLDAGYLKGVLASPYFPFIRFAIRNELIDNTYERFMTNFYSESLTNADRSLISAMAQGRSIDPNRDVDNTFAVASRLDADLLPWENVRVYALLTHLISYGPSSKLQKLLVGVEHDNDLAWLVGYTESSHFNPGVFTCMEQFLDHPIERILESDDFALERKVKFCHRLLAYGGNALAEERTRTAARDFAHSYPAFLKVECVQPKRLARGLVAIDYKPSELDTTDCNLNLVQFVYDHDLYEPVAKAIDSLVATLLETDLALPKGTMVTRVHSLDDTAVKTIVEQNADQFLASVLESTQVSLSDSPKAIAWMLGCKGVSPQHGLGYLKALDSSIALSDIASIGSYTYQGVLLDRSLVQCTPANILDYYTSAGNIVDEHLAALLEANPFPADFTMATTEEHLGSEAGFLKAVIECPSLSDEKVDEISSTYRAQFNHFDIPEVSESRMRLLILNGTVRTTADNLNFVRTSCPHAAQCFAEADINEYIRLVLPDADGEESECGFVRSEALDIFELRTVDDSGKVALLRGFSEPVSMMRSYSNELNAAIASRHFNVADLPLVDELYTQGNRKLKRALAEAIVVNREVLALSGLRLSMDMVADIAWRLRDNRQAMVEFIAEQLANRNPEPSRLEIRTVFERANLREYVALIDGPSSLVPDTSEDDALLAVLGMLGMAGKQTGKPDWQGLRRINSKGYSRK